MSRPHSQLIGIGLRHMPRVECIVESVPSEIALDESQAVALNDLGRRLASQKVWWGEEGDSKEQSVIRCSPLGMGSWRVRVADAVGVVAVPGLQVVVQPKIPMAHFLFILGESGHLPRLEPQPTQVALGSSLWEIVATWYMNVVETLLRGDLIRDYRPARDILSLVRGRIDCYPTAMLYYRGNLQITCEFEEFDADNCLNRVLKRASTIVAASYLLDDNTRRRALRVLARMDGVGDMLTEDLRFALERRSAHYADCLCLAQNIIAGIGRGLETGLARSTAFLLRTPEMVEDGLRKFISTKLSDKCAIGKRGKQLVGSKMTLNPDLVFDEGRAVGDIKYKLGNEWTRADLYQAVTFAEGFGTSEACIIGFGSVTGRQRSSVRVGKIDVTRILWSVDGDTTPLAAASHVMSELEQWLCEPSRKP